MSSTRDAIWVRYTNGFNRYQSNVLEKGKDELQTRSTQIYPAGVVMLPLWDAPSPHRHLSSPPAAGNWCSELHPGLFWPSPHKNYSSSVSSRFPPCCKRGLAVRGEQGALLDPQISAGSSTSGMHIPEKKTLTHRRRGQWGMSSKENELI